VEQNHSTFKGGGAYVFAQTSGNASPTFFGCTFRQNTAGFDGGGLVNWASGGTVNVVVDSSLFETNIVPQKGGAVLNWSTGGASNLTLTVRNTAFTGNTAQLSGGAIFHYCNSGGNLTCNGNDNDFLNNSSTSGGAIFVNTNGGRFIGLLRRCLFEANSTTSNGGAISVFNDLAGSNTNFAADSCHFSYNTSLDGGAVAHRSNRGGMGYVSISRSRFDGNVGSGRGGVHVQTLQTLQNTPGTLAITTFSNGIFCQNAATGGPGGAIAIQGSANTSSAVNLNNCTFFGHVCNGNGKVVFNSSFGGVSLVTSVNSIFWENTSFLATNPKSFWNDNASASLEFTNSLLEEATCAAAVGGAGAVTCGAGMLFGAYPEFTDPDNCDLSLLPGSPAIDAGTPNGAPLMDILGNPRPQGNAYDMGAYESLTPRALAREPEGLEGAAPLHAEVFPNPNTGTFTVRFDRSVEGIAQLFDAQGRLIRTEPLLGTDRLAWDIGTAAPSGAYLLRIVSGGEVVTMPVIVKKP
jgi:hypothetical protein